MTYWLIYPYIPVEKTREFEAVVSLALGLRYFFKCRTILTMTLTPLPLRVSVKTFGCIQIFFRKRNLAAGQLE